MGPKTKTTTTNRLIRKHLCSLGPVLRPEVDGNHTRTKMVSTLYALISQIPVVRRVLGVKITATS